MTGHDETGPRNNPTLFWVPAAIDDPYDYTRDGKVDGFDQTAARNNPRTFINCLRLITVPAEQPTEAPAAARPPQMSILGLVLPAEAPASPGEGSSPAPVAAKALSVPAVASAPIPAPIPAPVPSSNAGADPEVIDRTTEDPAEPDPAVLDILHLTDPLPLPGVAPTPCASR